jgi:hypothetical protein
MLLFRMVAIGAYLLVSVAAAAPAHADKVASMYEDAACDPAEGGECIVELDVSVGPATAILDCENPLIHDMIGSCDNPKPAIPSLRVATVRNGNGIGVARTATGERFTVVSATSSIDAALPLRVPSAAPLSASSPVAVSLDGALTDGISHRLERPPRV